MLHLYALQANTGRDLVAPEAESPLRLSYFSLPAGVFHHLRGVITGVVNGNHVWHLCIRSVLSAAVDSICTLTSNTH